MVFCRYCGKELHETAPTCPHCGAVQNQKDIAVPDGIKGWSWGAFLLNWIWAIGNRTWVGLLALVPLAGVIMAFILGFKGREWAWRNKHWESVEHFNQVQKKWSVWGVSIFACIVVIIVINGVLRISAYQDYVERAKQAEPSWQSNEPSSQSLPQLEQPAESLQAPAIEAERWMDDGVAPSTEPPEEMPLDNNDVDAIAKSGGFEKGKLDSAIVGECLSYSSVELRGVLRSETFPGPPNYKSIAAGDRSETFFFIVPASPLCVTQGDTSGFEPAATDVQHVQLTFSDKSAYDKLGPSLGKEVRCSGNIYSSHNGHHHSAVLLGNAECNAAPGP